MSPFVLFLIFMVLVVPTYRLYKRIEKKWGKEQALPAFVGIIGVSVLIVFLASGNGLVALLLLGLVGGGAVALVKFKRELAPAWLIKWVEMGRRQPTTHIDPGRRDDVPPPPPGAGF